MRLSKIIVSFFAITIAILTFLPINNYFRGSTKDYGNWFQVGQTVIEGGDIYPNPDDFPFMYPPTAAVLFAILSYLGELPLIIVLGLLYSIAWIVSLTPFGLPGDRYLGARSAAALPAARRLLPSVCDRELSPRATQSPSLGAHAYSFRLLAYRQGMDCRSFGCISKRN